MQANRKSGNSSAKNFVSLCHRIQSPELKDVKVSKVFLFLSLEYGKVIKLTVGKSCLGVTLDPGVFGHIFVFGYPTGKQSRRESK